MLAVILIVLMYGWFLTKLKKTVNSALDKRYQSIENNLVNAICEEEEEEEEECSMCEHKSHSNTLCCNRLCTCNGQNVTATAVAVAVSRKTIRKRKNKKKGE